jgi:hypothetical protein
MKSLLIVMLLTAFTFSGNDYPDAISILQKWIKI